MAATAAANAGGKPRGGAPGAGPPQPLFRKVGAAPALPRGGAGESPVGGAGFSPSRGMQ